MSPTLNKLIAALSDYRMTLFNGTPEATRADIAGTMLLTIMTLTQNQLQRINKIINE